MKEQIIKYIAAYKGVSESEIDADASFADLGLDSLDVAELIMQLEEAMNTTIEISKQINSINKLSEYLDTLAK